MTNMTWPQNIAEAQRRLSAGTTSATALLKQCLQRIDDPRGEGSRAFLKVYRASARARAQESDRGRLAGHAPGLLEGIPVSVKDLFDEAGEITRAGSIVLTGATPATRDAAAVAALRQAGAVIVGRTNMTEFAYSGLGINPHYGTPLAPYDRASGRVPGGSTAGGAVAVADGMCLAALGSDTGGSVRIPAAFCGLVGFKPTAGRLSSDGAFPLAHSFDSVGVVTRSVGDSRLLDAAIRGTAPITHRRAMTGLRIGIATGFPCDALDATVAGAFERALSLIGAAGALLHDIEGFDWSAPGRAQADGRITAVEARVVHDALFRRSSEYDPRVATRIKQGEGVAATDYFRAQQALIALRREIDQVFATCDAVVLPTVSCLPPLLADTIGDDGYFRSNATVLRNTSIANALNLCALSVPIIADGDAPVGLMIMAPPGRDQDLLDIGETIAAALA